MHVTEITNDGLKRAYKIVVPAATLAGQVDTRLAEMSKTAVLPGFRRGKVPVPLLRKQYGKALFSEAVEKAVNEGVGKAVEDNGLRPALQPQISVKSLGEDKDLEFDLTVEVMPDIGEMDFGTIELERLKVVVEEQAVNEALDRIAGANKEQKELAAPRPAAKGDLLKVDFTGYVDGAEFPNNSATDYTLELGSASLIPGFEDQLIGAAPGEQREVKVTFPAEYGNEALAGKEATFKVTVKEIRELVAVPVDDALAKKSGFDNLDAMRQAVRERLEQDYNRLSRTVLKRRLLDKLAERCTFAVPAGLVDIEFEAIWKQVEDARAAAKKPESEAADDEARKAEDEKLKAEYRGIAERRVRLGLLLAEVGRKNNIEVSAAEINQAVIREAQRFPGQERQVLEFYQKSPELRDRLRAPIFEDKTIDFVIELAKVTDKPVTPEELLKAVREAEEDKAADA